MVQFSTRPVKGQQRECSGRIGMQPVVGMVMRNYDRQAGEKVTPE